jgi:hypothetical protein
MTVGSVIGRLIRRRMGVLVVPPRANSLHPVDGPRRNLFEVPAGADEGSSEPGRRPGSAWLSQDGYRSTALHRSLGSDAESWFVNMAEWASAAAFQAATSHPDDHGRDMPSRLIPGCTSSWPRTRHQMMRTQAEWC